MKSKYTKISTNGERGVNLENKLMDITQNNVELEMNTSKEYTDRYVLETEMRQRRRLLLLARNVSLLDSK